MCSTLHRDDRHAYPYTNRNAAEKKVGCLNPADRSAISHWAGSEEKGDYSMKSKLYATAIGAVVATMLAMAPPVTAQETVTVGVVSFLSGPAAGPFGVPARNGAEMVIDAINSGSLPAPYNTVGFAGAKVEADFLDAEAHRLRHLRHAARLRGGAAPVRVPHHGPRDRR
jgi:hypothetical protein